MTYTYAPCSSCHSVNKVNIEKAHDAAPICSQCKAKLPLHGAVIDIDGKGLDKLADSSPLPIVVDFWAEWCGPCKFFAPVFKEASEKFKGKVVFAKLNTEQDPNASAFYQVRGIPTVMIVNSTGEVARQAGAMPLDVFSKWLSSHVKIS